MKRVVIIKERKRRSFNLRCGVIHQHPWPNDTTAWASKWPHCCPITPSDHFVNCRPDVPCLLNPVVHQLSTARLSSNTNFETFQQSYLKHIDYPPYTC